MMQAQPSIQMATTPAHYAAFEALVLDYATWCRERFKDDKWLVEEVFGHQAAKSGDEPLAVTFGPPRGRSFLVVAGEQVMGCGAYRVLADGSCEMKRVFVPDAYKGRGIGRQLCTAIVDAARADGYALMRLDTGNRFTEAIGLYESFGFKRCAPHVVYPERLMPYMVFMELDLSQ